MSQRNRSDLLRNLSWMIVLVGAISFSPTRLLFAQFGGGEGGGAIQPPAPSKFDPLVRVIKNTISPDSWDDVGGPGSIEAVDAWGVMIVSQTDEVHEQIENLILTVRQARREQQAGAGAKAEPEEKAARKSVSLLIESPASATSRKRMDEALDGETSFDFLEASLAEVAETISEKHGINVLLDRRALEGVGIGVDTPVTLKLKSVSLRSALRLLLRELDLVYIIRDDVLRITTPEEANASLGTRVYKVEDLAVPIH